MSKLIIKVNDYYAFRDHEDNLHIPEEMMKELKAKMNYEEAIMCFMDVLLDLENKENRIDKAIEYIERVMTIIKEQPRTDIDDFWILEKLQIFLDILKGSDSNE